VGPRFQRARGTRGGDPTVEVSWGASPLAPTVELSWGASTADEKERGLEATAREEKGRLRLRLRLYNWHRGVRLPAATLPAPGSSG
jgi:hypothetical protein